jgi:hypothetical protein
MIRNPTILLLDEATSALDAASEKVVQTALDDLLTEHQGVAVVVAHRLTTIKNCHKIIVMEAGKKVEEGTHDELLQIQVKKDKDEKVSQGYYHTQWDIQMGEESFGSAEHMNGEQLDGREKYFQACVYLPTIIAYSRVPATILSPAGWHACWYLPWVHVQLHGCVCALSCGRAMAKLAKERKTRSTCELAFSAHPESHSELRVLRSPVQTLSLVL